MTIVVGQLTQAQTSGLVPEFQAGLGQAST